MVLVMELVEHFEKRAGKLGYLFVIAAVGLLLYTAAYLLSIPSHVTRVIVLCGSVAAAICAIALHRNNETKQKLLQEKSQAEQQRIADAIEANLKFFRDRDLLSPSIAMIPTETIVYYLGKDGVLKKLPLEDFKHQVEIWGRNVHLYKEMPSACVFFTNTDRPCFISGSKFWHLFKSAGGNLILSDQRQNEIGIPESKTDIQETISSLLTVMQYMGVREYGLELRAELAIKQIATSKSERRSPLLEAARLILEQRNDIRPLFETPTPDLLASLNEQRKVT